MTGRLWWATAVAALLAAGCTREPPPPLQRVTWQLTWDLQRLQREDGHWRWTTDRGYDVQLHAGLLVTWRLGLEPCPQRSASVLFPEAWAHHLEPPDPTSVLPHLREDLLAPQTVRLAPRAVPPVAYCRALWLASAPPQAQTDGLPRETLMLRGQWRRGDQQGQLSVSTWLPDARLDAVGGLSRAPAVATVTVERHLAAALDGVELAGAPTEALAWHVLHRLTADATLSVTPGAPAAP